MDEIKLYDKEFTVEELLLSDGWETAITIVTNADDIKLESRHNQDCCEHVYADFETFLLYESELVGKNCTRLSFRPVEDLGVIFIFEQSYAERTNVLVPTYNSQNGYYSSELRLGIVIGDVNSEIDISETTDNRDG